MKIICCGKIIKENHHVLLNQFHGNFRSKTLGCRRIKFVFRDVKWCFSASWGVKGLKGDTWAVNKREVVEGDRWQSKGDRYISFKGWRGCDKERREATKKTRWKGHRKAAKDDWKNLNGNWEVLKSNRESIKGDREALKGDGETFKIKTAR